MVAAALEVPVILLPLYLRRLVGLGGAVELNKVVAQLQNEGVRQLLGTLHGDGSGLELLLQEVAAVLIDPAQGDAVGLRVGMQHELVDEDRLHGLPIGPGRILGDPGKTVRHHLKLFFAVSLRLLRSDVSDELGIAAGEDRGCLSDLLDGAPGGELIGIAAVDMAADGIHMLLGLVGDVGPALVNYLLVVGAEVALGHIGGHILCTVAEGGAVIALEGPDLIREKAQHPGGNCAVTPVLHRLTVDLTILVGDVVEAAGGLAVRDEVLIGLVHHIVEPGSAPLDVVAGGTPLTADVADEHGVLLQAERFLLTPGVQGACALHLFTFRFVGFIVIGIDPGPLGIKDHVAVVVLSPLGLDGLDPGADRCNLIHIALLSVTLFFKCLLY